MNKEELRKSIFLALEDFEYSSCDDLDRNKTYNNILGFIDKYITEVNANIKCKSVEDNANIKCKSKEEFIYYLYIIYLLLFIYLILKFIE